MYYAGILKSYVGRPKCHAGISTHRSRTAGAYMHNME